MTEDNKQVPDPGNRVGDRSGNTAYDASEREEPQPARKPSQAEGDRETIEADIREKEAEGEL
jgi:hypothetical protein